MNNLDTSLRQVCFIILIFSTILEFIMRLLDSEAKYSKTLPFSL